VLQTVSTAHTALYSSLCAMQQNREIK